MKQLIIIFLAFTFSHTAWPQTKGINHIVLCWLNQPGNQTDIEAVMKASIELKGILEVDSIVVGQPVPSNRKIVDDSFDVGLVINFNNQKNLDNYLAHPEHVKRAKEILAPKCQRILIYDITY
jgi:hypothetical protein